jgi:hypothetical protein
MRDAFDPRHRRGADDHGPSAEPQTGARGAPGRSTRTELLPEHQPHAGEEASQQVRGAAANRQRAGDWAANESLMMAMGLGGAGGGGGGVAPNQAAATTPTLIEVYRLYRRVGRMSLREAAGLPVGPTRTIDRQMGHQPTPAEERAQLHQQLAQHGFASIAEFASYVQGLEQAFEHGAAKIVFELLDKYTAKLHSEGQRYRDPGVVAALYDKLSGFRAQHEAFEANAQVWNDYAAQSRRDSERGRVPGNGGVVAKAPTPQQAKAGAQAKAAKVQAETSIKDLAREYPIFAEDDLPIERRIDKTKLAQASKDQLGGVLQAHLAERTKAVAEARGQLAAAPELVYKMSELTPVFYAQLNIQPGSIHDLVLQDKRHADAVTKVVGGLLLALVAVALTVVSLGAATPAVAAAAAAGAAGLSTYVAVDEVQHYSAEHALAAAGLADDPSLLWLGIAIVGAGVDLAVAAHAARALAPAARALEAGGDLATFKQAVTALEKSQQLDANVAAAADQAAAARRAYSTARGELFQALGKAYSLPGPFTDPDVYRALVKMAVAKMREGGHSLAGFLAELRQARLQAKLAELSPDELAKVNEAWQQAELLANSAQKPIDIVGESGRVIGRYSNGSHLEIIHKGRPTLHGGNTIRLAPDTTTTVTGTLRDVETVAIRGQKLPGVTVMGDNPGGINILRSPKWNLLQEKYKVLLEAGDTTGYWKAVTNEFWDTANKPWLDDAIARGDSFRFVSDPSDEKAVFVTIGKDREFVLDGGAKIQSIFGREVDYLRAKGYVFSPDGTATKVK